MQILSLTIQYPIPPAANCTDINGETYQNRDEDIRSKENDILLSANLETKFSNGTLQLRLKGYNYSMILTRIELWIA